MVLASAQNSYWIHLQACRKESAESGSPFSAKPSLLASHWALMLRGQGHHLPILPPKRDLAVYKGNFLGSGSLLYKGVPLYAPRDLVRGTSDPWE